MVRVHVLGCRVLGVLCAGVGFGDLAGCRVLGAECRVQGEGVLMM